MARGKYQKRRSFSGLIVILVLVLLAAVFGVVYHFTDLLPGLPTETTPSTLSK